jgi:hypothetical protein
VHLCVRRFLATIAIDSLFADTIRLTVNEEPVQQLK